MNVTSVLPLPCAILAPAGSVFGHLVVLPKSPRLADLAGSMRKSCGRIRAALCGFLPQVCPQLACTGLRVWGGGKSPAALHTPRRQTYIALFASSSDRRDQVWKLPPRAPLRKGAACTEPRSLRPRCRPLPPRWRQRRCGGRRRRGRGDLPCLKVRCGRGLRPIQALRSVARLSPPPHHLVLLWGQGGQGLQQHRGALQQRSPQEDIRPSADRTHRLLLSHRQRACPLYGRRPMRQRACPRLRWEEHNCSVVGGYLDHMPPGRQDLTPEGGEIN